MTMIKLHNLMGCAAILFLIDAVWMRVMSQSEVGYHEPFQTGLLFLILGVLLKDKSGEASKEGNKVS